MKNADAAFTALGRIAEALSESLNEEDHLTGIAEILEEVMRMRRVTLLLLSACGDGLVLDGDPPDREVTSGNEHPIEYRKGEGVIGRVLESGRSRIVPRIADEPEFLSRIHSRPPAEARNFGFICVPIKFGNETVGALAADIPLEGAPENEPERKRCLYDDEKFLKVVAGIISHDVRLRRQSRLMNQALKRENQRLQS